MFPMIDQMAHELPHYMPLTHTPTSGRCCSLAAWSLECMGPQAPCKCGCTGTVQMRGHALFASVVARCTIDPCKQQ